MRLPFQARLERQRTRAALPEALRARLAALKRARGGFAAGRALRAAPLALARFVALDVETTGPRMDRDRIIAIGAVAVAERSVGHRDAFAAVLRQRRSSSVDNILVHRIGGQQQLGGQAGAEALVELLEFMGSAVAVAFRAEFDATVLARELELELGVRVPRRFVDLAVLLPALFPGTQNDTLEDWLGHFSLQPIGRHDALADAYMSAQLFLIALDTAERRGARTTGGLMSFETAQRWLGWRR
ncbi:MAG TPA: 3'-5' exonuclease [Steroidobacteraceae bacterium]|nr:3'-5' exonuclease [Steroidobacteraceae bacterium]